MKQSPIATYALHYRPYSRVRQGVVLTFFETIPDGFRAPSLLLNHFHRLAVLHRLSEHVQSRSVSNIYWNSDLAMALLPFQTEILDQILDNKRGLWVVHSGLGLQKIISHYIVQLEKRNLSRQLYLFLNPDSQSPVFEKLVQMAPHRYKLINSEYTSEQRYEMHLFEDLISA